MFDTDWSHPREHVAGSRNGLVVHLGRFCMSGHCRYPFVISVLATLAALFGAKDRAPAAGG